MEVRDATADDIAHIVELERSNFDRPWGIAVLEEELAREGAIFRVARLGPRCCQARQPLAGYVIGRRICDVIEVLRLCTDIQHRRSGVASRLLRALSAEGATKLQLEVSSANVAAISLYSKLGFVSVGARPGYYPDGSDALLMDRLVAVQIERV